ncbi:potassium channel family protein [Pseudonocardia alaniniphila]|uniref:Potassium channel family protein n=1 Tax=Pseudonocardia alaniniphila TaxID=75291 RepID=A0ABS9TNL8_9PSEU|nr:potassium channel family protein [Pseudonocardia alaniniphila]MCH6170003.1 potassium channel family protein [Pseudonocardia alaniniphila]
MTTSLVAVYYLAPLRMTLDLRTWLRFALVLLLLGVLAVRQVQAVLRSETPRVRAIEAAATGLPIFILLFATIYLVIANNRPDSFSETLDRTDALYFTLTVFTTVGFGDIVPRTEVARIVTMLQMVMGLILVGLVARMLLSAVQVAVRRRERGGPDATPPSE